MFFFHSIESDVTYLKANLQEIIGEVQDKVFEATNINIKKKFFLKGIFPLGTKATAGAALINEADKNPTSTPIFFILKHDTTLNQQFPKGMEKDKIKAVIGHELTHLLFHTGGQRYNQEYLSDAVAVKLFGKDSFYHVHEEIFSELTNLGLAITKDTAEHPSAFDRRMAFYNDEYSAPATRIIEEVKIRSFMGRAKHWVGALIDKLPSDFIGR